MSGPAFKDDIDGETYHAFIKQLAARHASREMYEGNSFEVRDVEEKGSYISRAGANEMGANEVKKAKRQN